ncbi:MAG: efflux RND transporter periplasmic adaptor subunit [Phycisphaerales bacterium]
MSQFSQQTLDERSTRRDRRARGSASRTLIIATAALIVVAGGTWGLYALANPSSAGTAHTTADIHVVSETSFNISTTCNGELEAKRQIEVRSKLDNSSTIAWIIPEGTSVKTGDELVRLNSDDLETRRIEAELQVENAKAALVKAETELQIQEKENSSKVSAAQVKHDLAVLALEQWEKGDKIQKQEDNKQAIAKAQAEHERLKEKYEKSVTLEKEGFVSTDELKRDRLAYDEAVRALEKAQLAQKIYNDYQVLMDGTQKRSDVEQAQSELERVTQQADIELNSKQTARNTAKRLLEVQEQKLAKLVEAINNATLRAPADGLVVYSTSMERNRWGDSDGPLQIGRQVYPNQLLIVLPDTTEMVASVRIHESLQARVKPGQRATVKIDAAGGRSFQATVDSIGILAESGGWRDPNLREYTVKLQVDSEGAVLKPAMRCEAEIVMGQVEHALTIPIQGIFNDGVVRFAYVPSDGKFVRRPIKVGRMSLTMAEVSAGLQPGDRILLRDPSAAEIIDAAWDDQQLLAAGYSRNDDGQIVRPGMSGDRPKAPGGAEGAANRGPGRGRPGGAPRTAGGGSTDGATKPAGDAAADGHAAKPESGAEADSSTPAAPASDSKPASKTE